MFYEQKDQPNERLTLFFFFFFKISLTETSETFPLYFHVNELVTEDHLS